MTDLQKDPILQALVRIEAKQDLQIAKTEEMEQELREIRKECRRTSALYGGLGGAIVSTGWEFIRLKLGG
ncbi:hypothetical protein J2T38_001704 [Neisseria perflava]|uniref:hypothetical protein n=1 Tax=Neisseria perflava TaxID=33053 RepID=UPI00209D6BF3|nr:hypothetical protein [Neisseria perflava]MCP1772868.1 hypothetical protein [Neisseria perflava]